MQLTAFRAYRLRIPFRSRFSHALASRDRTDSVLLALTDAEGRVGYGEGTPRPYVTGETADRVGRTLLAAAGRLVGADLPTVHALQERLDADPTLASAPSARCALELALLDLMGKTSHQPVLDLLGTPRAERVFYSAVVGTDHPEQLAKLAQRIAQVGVRQVKLKVGADAARNREAVRLLRGILGEGVELRADANAAWSLDEAPAHLATLADEGVFHVEQPLSAADRDAWLALRTRIGRDVRVCADESVCTLADARWLAEHRAVDGFNLKVSKHGGIGPTLAVHELATQNGLFCQLGCHVGETSLLSAAGRLVAALTGDLRACEGSYGLLLLENDLTPAPLQAGFEGVGTLAELRRPGLGVEVELDGVRGFLEPVVA